MSAPIYVLLCFFLSTALSFTPFQHRYDSSSSRQRRPVTRLHWHSSISRQTNGIEAVQELLQDVERPTKEQDEQGLVFLFVSQFHAEEFEGIIKKAYDALGDDDQTVLLALVGGGVIGGNTEYDDPVGPPAMSMLSGVLPSTARASAFSFSPEEEEDLSRFLGATNQEGGASHVVFVDPWADMALLQKIGKDEDVVIGGLSCPVISDLYPAQPSIALNGKTLPLGSAVGVSLTGSIGLQAVVAQGCRPIGPIFTITSAVGKILNALDGASALEQLQRIANEASDSDKVLIQSGILCGVTAKGAKDNNDIVPQDFLIRQITGIMAVGQGQGAISIGVPDLREGDQFQFHVRDAKAAQEDMKVMMQRTKTERSFAGPEKAGVPVAALQVSCVARGRGLFGTPNVDLGQVNQLLGLLPENDPDKAGICSKPVAGFFASGEIGPVGISGFGSTSTQGTYIHGFTTVVGLLCDFSGSLREKDASTECTEELSSDETWG